MSRRNVAARTSLIGSYLIALVGGLGWLLFEPSPLAYSVPNRVGVFIIVAAFIAFVVWPFAAAIAIWFDRKRWIWVVPGWFLVANPGALAGWLYIVLN